MPAQYAIDRAHRVVLTKFSGVLTVGEVIEHATKLGGDPDFEPSFAEIVDMSEATEVQLTYLDLRETAEVDPFSRDPRRAFVIPSRNSVYGVVRMFHSISGAEAELKIFETQTAAWRWLLPGE